jgi:glucose-6-phosphate isomerase
VTITIKILSPFSIGVLIALFERAVGLYASLVNINAYHQPGVEAGKKAAASIIELQGKILSFLSQHSKQAFTIDDIAKGIGAEEGIEHIFKTCEHLSANPSHKIRKTVGAAIFDSQYSLA